MSANVRQKILMSKKKIVDCIARDSLESDILRESPKTGIIFEK